MTGSADALAAALAAEYAAIWGYGVIGAHLSKGDLTAAHAADTAHRNRRDALMIRLTSASPGTALPTAQPAYALPFPVTDRASALKLAVELEVGTGRAWYAALPVTSGDQRRLVLDALTDCAVRATRWRQSAGVEPVTVVFPGAPA